MSICGDKRNIEKYSKISRFLDEQNWFLEGVKLINDCCYFESIKRELKIKCIQDCRCDERLQTKTKECTRLAYTTVLVVELEHPILLKSTRLEVTR
jgi:hypothetical protein